MVVPPLAACKVYEVEFASCHPAILLPLQHQLGNAAGARGTAQSVDGRAAHRALSKLNLTCRMAWLRLLCVFILVCLTDRVRFPSLTRDIASAALRASNAETPCTPWSRTLAQKDAAGHTPQSPAGFARRGALLPAPWQRPSKSAARTSSVTRPCFMSLSSPRTFFVSLLSRS